MLKKLCLNSALILCSVAAFANNNGSIESSKVLDKEMTSVVVSYGCGHTESGTLSCGIGYSICAKDREEATEIFGELECLNCSNCVDENDNPGPGN